MKLGSIGEIPPKTIGNPGFSRRTAWLAAITIAANRFQSGSSLKSQWERLLGSFHNISASTIHSPARTLLTTSPPAHGPECICLLSSPELHGLPSVLTH